MNINVDNNSIKISDIKCENCNYKTNNIKIEQNPFSRANIKNDSSNSRDSKDPNLRNSKRSSNMSKSTNSYGERISIRMQKKRSRYNYDEDEDNDLEFSSRHTAYLIAIWLVFLAVFITGFIVHFDTTNNVTASSILWTFSGVLCFFALIYSFLYYKCAKAKNDFERHKYLKFIPC